MVHPCTATASHIVRTENATPAIWAHEPGRRLKLSYRSLGIDPDGSARFLVRATFLNVNGQEAALASGGDVEFFTNNGTAEWQTRSRFGGPAAIIRTTDSRDFDARVVVERPSGIDASNLHIKNVASAVVVRPLGAYAVQVGWFPKATRVVRVQRTGPHGMKLVCAVAPPSSSCLDAGAQPGMTYTYTVKRTGAPTISASVTLSQKPAVETIDAFRGKGMWLRFSPQNSDNDAYSKLDPALMARTAHRAGLRYVELRLSYGDFWELTPAAKPTIDKLIDEFTKARIAVFAWSVPRSASFDDIATTISAANYRTPRGSRMAGIAIDLERGTDYFGDGLAARNSIATYVATVRRALGHESVIIATVEDPYSGKLTERDVPYAEVAENASALQPMAYWRMYEMAVGADQTASFVDSSIQKVRTFAAHKLSINFGGQTLGLGECGAPPPNEIHESLKESKASGAIGETFFDWNGTYSAQWAAIRSFRW